MARTGLPYGFILDTALQLVEEKGFDKFSMHDLAKALGIKTPSLYNHFSGIKQLQKELALKIEQDLYQQSTQAMKDKSPDDMIRALAHTQLEYAKLHPHLYQVILSLPTIEKNNLTESALSKSDSANYSSAKAFATAQALTNPKSATRSDANDQDLQAQAIIDKETATSTESGGSQSVNPSLSAIQRQYGLTEDDYYFRHFQQFQRPNAAWHSVEPIRIALNQYQLSKADSIHLNRMFRSMIHGYISLAAAGYLAHQKYSTQESFDATVEYFISLVHLQEMQNTNNA